MAKTRAQISKDYRLRKIEESGDPEYWKKYQQNWRDKNPMEDENKRKKQEYNNKRYKEKKNIINEKRKRSNLTPEKLMIVRQQRRQYYENNPNACIAATYRDRILHALRRQSIDKKCFSSVSVVGCSWEELIIYLESKFADGMNWNNHGRGIDKWHVDHIIPCSHFDLSKYEEVRKCFHYTNTRPLWETDNLNKNDKLPDSYINGTRIWTDEGWKEIPLQSENS